MAKDVRSAGKTVNGVDTDALGQVIRAATAQPEVAKFQFRARNRWVNGGQNETTIDAFLAAGQPTSSDNRPFTLEADEPLVLLGHDEAPNPVEYLLQALAACVTSSMVYHAASRGIRIEELESELEGDLDVRGFMGVADGVRPGYSNVRVTFRVRSDADPAELEKLTNFSPVLDVVRHGTNVEIKVTKA